MCALRSRKRILLLGVALIGAVAIPLALRAQSAKAITNSDVVKMVKGGVPESVIVSSIQSSPSSFDLSPDALIRLHRMGVPKKIMDAMMAAAAKGNAANAAPAPSAAPPPAENPSASAPPPAEAAPAGAAPAVGTSVATSAAPPPSAGTATPGLPTVAFLQNGTAQPLAIERTQLEETKTKPSSMLSLASDSALTPIVQGEVNQAVGEIAGHVNSQLGGATVAQAGSLFSGIVAHRKPELTYVWAVPNVASSNVLPTTVPSFFLDFSNVPGVNPAEYAPAIVKLTPSQNTWRLVGATQGKDDATSSSALNWQIYANFLEDHVALHASKSAPGQYQISPAAPLLPGEYAVVLRPISKSKKYSGADVARDQGDGLAFDSVWSFQVPPGATAQ